MLYQATDDSYKFCHHPNLVIFKSQLFCMWSNGKVHEDTVGQRVLYSQTSDGMKWSEPKQLTDLAEAAGVCVAAGWNALDQEIVAYYTRTGGSNFHPETMLMARTSLAMATDGDRRTKWRPGFFYRRASASCSQSVAVGWRVCGQGSRFWADALTSFE